MSHSQVNRQTKNKEIPTIQDINNYSENIHHELKKDDRPCFIQQLSVEIVTHIFARLDPISLATVSKVCSYWRHIVNNDYCWRDAFVSYFGCLPFKRICLDSWKTEYILRTHLIRKWTKGRGTIMSFNPKIGSLQSMYVNSQDTNMVVASLDQGVAAKCNMITGKIDRHLLYSTNDNIRLQITAVKVDRDRILWGFGHGYITLSIRTNSISSRLKVFSDFHQAPVKILALPTYSQEVVFSGAEDGQVKIWDVTTTSCAWTLYPTSSLAKEPTVIETVNDQYIIIGYDDGSIVIWDINLYQLTQLNRSMGTDDYLEKRNNMEKSMDEKKTAIGGNGNGVKFISYDLETNTFIVTYNNETKVCKYNVNTGKCIAVFDGGHVIGNSISCVQWDQSTSMPIVSLESALNPRPTTRKKKGGIIPLSSTSSSSSSSSAIGTPKSGRRSRLLVTGDNMGIICLWNGDENGTVKPIRVLSGHFVGISSIYIDACKIVTGSDDGWIRMWNPLTGEIINTLGNKIPKGAAVDRNDINMMQVKNIWCNDYQGVATIGHQVKCWDFSVGKQFLNHSLKQKAKPCNNISRDRIKYEVKESLKKFETEKIEIEKEKKQINKMSLGGLSNDEMLDYALMISTQEDDYHQLDSVEDEDEELLKAVIASLELTENTNSDTSSSMVSQDEDWPTPSELNRPQTEEEELQYILELSKTEQ